MYGHVTEAYWKDVGNLKIYRETQGDVMAGTRQCPAAAASGGQGRVDGRQHAD